jgi:hypothetical protein
MVATNATCSIVQMDRAGRRVGLPLRKRSYPPLLNINQHSIVVLGLSVLVDDVYWFVLINSLSYYWKKRCQLTTEKHEGKKKNNNHFSIAAGAVE